MKSKHTLRAYLVSLAAVAAAVVIRWAVNPWLGDYVPLATLYGAVAIAVWIAGARAALIAAVLGYVAIIGLFILPEGSIRFFDKSNLIGLALYSISCALIIGVGEGLRRERRNTQVASQQVRIVADTMSVGVTRCSRDMRYLWVNQSYCDWIRRPAHELLGRLIADVVGEEAFAELTPYLERVLDGETIHYEKEVQFKDVPPSFISATYTPTRDENGVVDGWVAVVVDITDQKSADRERAQLNEDLRNRVEELQKLMDIFPGGILTADAACERITGNPAFYKILGLAGGGNVSLPASDSELPAGTRIFRNGRELLAEEYPMQAAGLTGTTILDFDHDIVFPDGRTVTLLANTTPLLDEKGNVRGVLGAYMDITTRKQVEDELRSSRARIRDDLDALTRLHAVANLCGTFDVSFDNCLEAILDAAIAFTRADRGNIQLLNRDDNSLRLAAQRGFEHPFLRVFAVVDEADAAACGHAMHTGERVIVEDVAHSELFAGQPTRAVLLDAGVHAVQSTPLLTSKGDLIGMISTHYARPRTFEARELRWMDVLARQAADYLDRKRGEEALREADRKKDEFLAMLSHELRNPLAPIGYAAEILKKSDPSHAQLAKAREVIDRQVRQMARLLDDLMDVSRITRGTISLRRNTVDLAAVVNNAVETSRPLIDEAGHTLRVNVPSAPVVIDVDATRLSQVLMNLLNNAAKYTERGGNIDVTAAVEGGSVVIGVKDTGVGIPAEMLPHVFELFAQEDRSLDRSRGGLGIGLSLAQRLVALHGGTLEARSDGAGRGSEFVIRLPVVSVKSEEVISSKPEKTNGAHPMRILVVDDNEDSADAMAMYLESNGHDVRTANDGLDAVATASEFQPAAVLMDIGLPKLNGYEAATRIRAQRGSGVLLVALTGWGQEADRRRSREAGFDHHLTKPVELDELRRLLSTAQIPAPGP